MRNLAYDILAGILLLVVGFAIGWHAKGVSARAGETRAAHTETAAVITGVNKQASKQHADAMVEQGKSLALATAQSSIREDADQLQADIDHASFTFPVPNIELSQAAMVVSCPPDPVGSAEFVRLYTDAAHGEYPAASASTSPR